MSVEKLSIGLLFVLVLCVTTLITHCTYSSSQCREEALKAGKLSGSEIKSLCNNGGG